VPRCHNIRNALANEPVACWMPIVTNGHSTKPTSQATAQEKPLPTPRIRVG